MTRTQRRPPAVWIWSGIIVVVVIVIGVMYWAFNLQPSDELPSNVREIPPLAGLTYEEAATQLQALDLPATPIEATSDTVPEGQVIRTDPPETETVDMGTTVSVFVSTGRQPVAVPDVRNKNLEQAKTDLVAAGLVPGAETRENSPTIAADTVLGTNPEPSASVPVGSTVDFRISNGMVTLTDLTGQTLTAATSFLAAENLQLNAIPKPDPSCDAEQGSPVTAQSLPPGEVPQHSDVELTYCAG